MTDRKQYSWYTLGQDMALILHRQELTMGLLEDVRAELLAVRDIVAADQLADAATVAGLKDQIAALQAEILATGGNAVLEEILAALKGIAANVTPA